MYVHSQSILDNADEMDLYFCYMRNENALLESQRDELHDRCDRRDAAWRNLVQKDARSYDEYADAASHYVATHNACKSAFAIVDATKARVAKYEARLAAL